MPGGSFTMCSDDGCPLKETCKRHEASGTIPSESFQSWYTVSPRYLKASDTCKMYWRVYEKRTKENNR